MEYNYTREFKQPHKIYSIKGVALPFAPNGIRLEQIFVGIGILILLLIFAIISFVAKINFFTTIIANFWLILIVGVGVLVWTFFSLKWDNKSFLDYLIGRGNFLYQKKKRYEHGLLVQFHKEKVQYKVRK